MVTTDKEERKGAPLLSGLLKYFPDALLEVAKVSVAGQAQHNPDKPLFWDRSRSTDEGDALARHLLEAGTDDADGVPHSAKVAWRALAMLQKECEAKRSLSGRPSAQGWRPIACAPDTSTPVIVRLANGSVTTGWKDPGGWVFQDSRIGRSVTHWMDIPPLSESE